VCVSQNVVVLFERVFVSPRTSEVSETPCSNKHGDDDACFQRLGKLGSLNGCIDYIQSASDVHDGYCGCVRNVQCVWVVPDNIGTPDFCHTCAWRKIYIFL
jgi:hypothetical protein